MSAHAPRLATLQALTQTESDQGGEVTTWTPLAALWVVLTPGAATFQQLEGQAPVRIETAAATARDHPDAAAGQQLLVDGPPWRVLAVQRPRPGRMVLVLDRTA